MLPGTPQALISGYRRDSQTVYEALPAPSAIERTSPCSSVCSTPRPVVWCYSVGRAKFTDMAPEQRATALLAMEGNRLEIVRKGIRALKTLAALLWVTTDDPANPPAAWAAMGYPGPDGAPPATPKTITTEVVDRDTTIECDVVVSAPAPAVVSPPQSSQTPASP